MRKGRGGCEVKRLILIVSIAMTISGCNNATRVFDSEISAINRQTEVLREQNHILERIAAVLEKEGGAK